MKNEFECFLGFQWDQGNIDKNLIKHKVENWECEQIFFNRPLLVLDDPQHSIPVEGDVREGDILSYPCQAKKLLF
jgi:uncharacterized DUF497 family protein